LFKKKDEFMGPPTADASIAPCGLFCSNCGKFKKGRCKGCQVEAGFSRCPVRACCAGRRIETCAGCPDFKSPRDYRECPKVNNFIAKTISLFTGSDRPAALALLRDHGREKYLAAKRETGKM
jgi:hypothetical protein